jgi:hypothetical protein
MKHTCHQYSSTNASLTCTDCPTSLNSNEGSASCDRAASNYYLKYNKEGLIISLPCPSNAKCSGGYYYPRPSKNYWVDRSQAKFAGDVYSCPRATCTGATYKTTTTTSSSSSSSSAASSSSSSSSSSSLSSSGSGSSSQGNTEYCWNSTYYDVDNKQCNSEALQCEPGSGSALCG